MSLLDALKLVKSVQKPNGAVEEMYCRIFGKSIVASDSLVTVSHPFETELVCAPHTSTFLDAIKQVKNWNALTLNDKGLVVHGEININVPCINLDELPNMTADRALWTIDNSVVKAIIACADSIPDTNKLSNVIQINNGMAICTNGNDAIQIYHGYAIGKYHLPRHAAKILNKWADKKICVMFGFGESSVTFWYDDSSWVKCQLYPNTIVYPDINEVLTKYDFKPEFPVDNLFFKTLKSVSKFTDKYASISNNVLMCHKKDNWIAQAMTMGLANVSSGPFELESMLSLNGIATSFNFSNQRVISWLGDNSRGVISKHELGS